jgi:hypothetical protein
MAVDKAYDEIFGVLDNETDAKKIEEERDRLMTECFRRVFSTDEGKIVLHQILEDLMFYKVECVNDSEVILNNFAKFMIFERLKCDNYKQMTSAIFDCRKQ